MEILGVRIDDFSRQEILERIGSFLSGSQFSQIVTVNPEFALLAQEDPLFLEIINTSSLSLIDGFGIVLALKLKKQSPKTRFSGADMIQEILKMAESGNRKIFILAEKNGLSSWREIRKALLESQPGLKIRGMNWSKKTSILPPIPTETDILFCNFGAPEQEKVIYSLKKQNDSKIRLAIGVGGGFDFLTGRIQRSPLIFRKIGLEWLWRFFQEPRYRFKRIFRSVAVFPIKVMLYKK